MRFSLNFRFFVVEFKHGFRASKFFNLQFSSLQTWKEVSISECPYNYYKSERGNARCFPCPENSFAGALGESHCTCIHNTFRASDEPKSMPCGGSPSPPKNVTAKVRGTHVTVTWERPISDGGRRDLFYSIQCATCKMADSRKVPVFSALDPTEIRALSVNITNLEPFTEYRFQIASKNALSKIRGVKSSYETVKFTTAENRKFLTSSKLSNKIQICQC